MGTLGKDEAPTGNSVLLRPILRYGLQEHDIMSAQHIVTKQTRLTEGGCPSLKFGDPKRQGPVLNYKTRGVRLLVRAVFWWLVRWRQVQEVKGVVRICDRDGDGGKTFESLNNGEREKEFWVFRVYLENYIENPARMKA